MLGRSASLGASLWLLMLNVLSVLLRSSCFWLDILVFGDLGVCRVFISAPSGLHKHTPLAQGCQIALHKLSVPWSQINEHFATGNFVQKSHLIVLWSAPGRHVVLRSKFVTVLVLAGAFFNFIHSVHCDLSRLMAARQGWFTLLVYQPPGQYLKK